MTQSALTDEDRKKTRDWLNRYKGIKKSLKSREDSLKQFKQEVYNPSGTAKYAMEKYETLITEMLTEIEELKVSLKEIEIAIDSLVGYEKQVCIHRYINNIKWDQMHNYIDYGSTQCTRYEKLGVENIFRKYMKKILAG